MLENFLSGAVSLGFVIAAMMFLGFWRRTRAELFLAFAAAFGLLAINQAALTFTVTYLEERSWLYLIRLVAFLVIIAAIWRHNRSGARN